MFQRDEILESRAVSCALPHRKPTTAAKATGHEKGAKLTAHPASGAHGAKTLAKGRKATVGKSLFKSGKHTPSHGVAKTRAKTTARGGKANGGAKVKAAAAFKKAAIHATSHKSPSHKSPSHKSSSPAKVARPAVKARRK